MYFVSNYTYSTLRSTKYSRIKISSACVLGLIAHMILSLLSQLRPLIGACHLPLEKLGDRQNSGIFDFIIPFNFIHPIIRYSSIHTSRYDALVLLFIVVVSFRFASLLLPRFSLRGAAHIPFAYSTTGQYNPCTVTVCLAPDTLSSLFSASPVFVLLATSVYFLHTLKRH